MLVFNKMEKPEEASASENASEKKLAITQRLLGKYWSKTGSQPGSQIENAGLSASESASRAKTE